MKFIFTLISAFVILTVSVYSQPKEEVRSVWLTTVYNLDWPKTTGANTQKQEMINLLDKLKAANFNTIMLQVRGRGDLLYPSAIEPWAKILTGTLGSNPGYDPLAFTIQEAHKRGMEVHAWWVAVKVYGTGTPPNTSPRHIVLKRPDLCKLYSNEWWLDMGYPDSKTYLLNLAVEMIRNYALDGIHFDFLRYPNPDFDDAASYSLYGTGQDKSTWRRNNISNFVYALYDSVQRIRPQMKVGTAPIGIYRDLSTCNSGWDAYTQVFQDSRRWMLARKHDYLSPQIYWPFNNCPRFDTLMIDWVNGSGGRHVYAGIATYRMAASEGDWPASEILAQVDSSRKFGGKGQTYFRTQSFLDNQKSIYSLIKANQYLYPANIPSMAWKDAVKPLSPGNLQIVSIDSTHYKLIWSKPAAASDGDTAIYYNVYRDDNPDIDFTDIKKVVGFRVVNDTSFNITFTTPPVNMVFYAVTAYDKGYNESLPSNTVYAGYVGIDERYASSFKLNQNYPNPFSQLTMINYQLSAGSKVELKVYDILGREIAVIVDEEKQQGSYEVEFNAGSLPSGVYYLELIAGKQKALRKMMVIK